MSRNLIVLPSFGGNKKMKKLAIIGASYLQEPLIEKAKSMGIETHVFAWAAGDVGEKSADYFYPISIVEKDEILKRCREIGIDGICTIASDLAVITVNYVANNIIDRIYKTAVIIANNNGYSLTPFLNIGKIIYIIIIYPKNHSPTRKKV